MFSIVFLGYEQLLLTSSKSRVNNITTPVLLLRYGHLSLLAKVLNTFKNTAWWSTPWVMMSWNHCCMVLLCNKSRNNLNFNRKWPEKFDKTLGDSILENHFRKNPVRMCIRWIRKEDEMSACIEALSKKELRTRPETKVTFLIWQIQLSYFLISGYFILLYTALQGDKEIWLEQKHISVE